jgi:hypothetical protein
MANGLGIVLPSGDCMSNGQLQAVIDQLAAAIIAGSGSTTINPAGALLANGTVPATACLTGVGGCVSPNNLAVWSDINNRIDGITRHLDGVTETRVSYGTVAVTFDAGGIGTTTFSNAFSAPPTVLAITNASLAIGTTTTTTTSATFVCTGAASTTRAVAYIAIGNG